MARYAFQGTFRDGQGNIVSGGTITVYLAGTDTTATIYEDDTTVTSTSYVESDDNGYFIFYIDSSDYSASQFFDIQLAKSGYTTKLYPSISIVPLWPTDETIEVTDNTTNDVSASAHGWTPKLSDSASDFLDGKGNWDAVSDADLEVTDITTNNASTSAHGFLKKLDNEATHFMDGTGAWDTVKDSDLALTDITDNDVSTTKHGFAPKLPDDSAQFLNGTGNWATPSGGGGGGSVRQTVLSASISNGVPNYISAGTGLAADIAATTTPIRIAFAAGFGESGAVDHVGTVDTDTSISSLTPNAINYLYAERDSETGVITLGATIHEPHYGNVAEYPQYGGTGSGLEQQIGYNTNNHYAGQRFSPGDCVSPGIVTGYMSRVRVKLRKYGTPTGGVLTMELQSDDGSGNPSGTALETSSNSITETDLTTTPTFTEFTFAGTYELTAGTVYHLVIKFSGRSASTSNYSSVVYGGSGSWNTTGAEYCNDSASWTVYGSYAWDIWLWQKPKHFFSIPEMVMYEWSGSAWTAKQRVFLGEAVTDGSGVTSVVNYALRGKYYSAENQSWSSGTYLNFAHNIGYQQVKARLIGVCKVDEYGYGIGQTIDLSNQQLTWNTGSAGFHLAHIDRNNAGITSHTGIATIQKGGAQFFNLTTSKWALILEAERGWN